MRPRLITISILVSAALMPAFNAAGQEALPLEVHFSYEAQNIAPWDYLIRAAAPLTPNTTARIAATLLETGQNGTQRLIDPGRYEFRWYFNDSFVAAGAGRTAIEVTLPAVTGTASTVRLRVSDARRNLAADDTLILPTSRPTVGLFRMTDDGESLVQTTGFTVPANVQTAVRVKPYFFSAETLTRLSFAWTLANKPLTGGTGDPTILRITIPADTTGADYGFSVTVTNTDNQRETAESALTLHIQ